MPAPVASLARRQSAKLLQQLRRPPGCRRRQKARGWSDQPSGRRSTWKVKRQRENLPDQSEHAKGLSVCVACESAGDPEANEHTIAIGVGMCSTSIVDTKDLSSGSRRRVQKIVCTMAAIALSRRLKISRMHRCTSQRSSPLDAVSKETFNKLASELATSGYISPYRHRHSVGLMKIGTARSTNSSSRRHRRR